MRYNPALDGLRAVAAITVVAGHSFVFDGAAIGVVAFFVLSGYLITSILSDELDKTGRIDLVRFYWHRALRLWPPLLLMLAAWAVAVIVSGGDPAEGAILAGLYLSDYARALDMMPESLAHTWSLAVEEHFYMLLPGLLILTRSVRFFAWAVILSAAWRCIDFAIWQNMAWTYFRFDTSLAALLLGCLIALYPIRGSARLGIGGAAALLALVIAFDNGNPLMLTLGYVGAAIASAALVLSLTDDNAVSRAFSALAYPGQLSYSVYLWHYPIALAVRDRLDPLATFAVVMGASFLIAWLSFKAMERPLRDWRRRLRHTADRSTP